VCHDDGTIAMSDGNRFQAHCPGQYEHGKEYNYELRDIGPG
jgi:hypothetical protein